MVENVKELLKAHEGITHEVYLDNENSTMVPQEVVNAMLPYYNQRAYGNPTLTHKPGWEAFETIMESAQKIAQFLGAKILEEVTFTPSETEANNLALMGSAFANKNKGAKIVISEIEPINVLHVTELLKKFGFTTTKIPVDSEGFLNLEKLKETVDKETILVSVALVNNEVGTIQPVKEAVEIVKDKNPSAVFHTDASDAYGRIPLNMQEPESRFGNCEQLQDFGTTRNRRVIRARRRERGQNSGRPDRDTKALAGGRKYAAYCRFHGSL